MSRDLLPYQPSRSLRSRAVAFQPVISSHVLGSWVRAFRCINWSWDTTIRIASGLCDLWTATARLGAISVGSSHHRSLNVIWRVCATATAETTHAADDRRAWATTGRGWFGDQSMSGSGLHLAGRPVSDPRPRLSSWANAT